MKRRLTALALLTCGALALIGAAQGWDAKARAASSSLSQNAAQGRALFESSCASCHGPDAQGIGARAPSLRGVGALAADFYLETGRMPLSSPTAQPLRTRPAFPEHEIKELIAYVASFGGPAIPTVSPHRGSLSEGQRLFALDCAGCHTIQGQGGIVTGAFVPSLNQATPTQVAEALRIGPYVMPRFGEGELTDAQVNSLARYVASTQHPENLGGWGIGRIGPIPEGMVAWLVAIAALLVIARLLGERSSERQDPPGRGGPERK